MLAIRISAAMAILFVLWEVAGFFMPLFYHQPLQLHFGDIMLAITCTGLLVGALFAFLARQSSILIAAWSWVMALTASQLVHVISYPDDFRAAVAKAGSPEKQAMMRHLFEEANEMDVRIRTTYCVVTLIALVLVLTGNLNQRSRQR